MIINNPDHYLLTQSELFAAEGGATGVVIQSGVMAATYGAFFARYPKTMRYLMRGQLTSAGWMKIVGLGFVGYHLGATVGTKMAGDSQKAHNHWMAYFYQKQLNRFEGRQILTAAHSY